MTSSSKAPALHAERFLIIQCHPSEAAPESKPKPWLIGVRALYFRRPPSLGHRIPHRHAPVSAQRGLPSSCTAMA
jgi:hypothetical protein